MRGPGSESGTDRARGRGRGMRRGLGGPNETSCALRKKGRVM